MPGKLFSPKLHSCLARLNRPSFLPPAPSGIWGAKGTPLKSPSMAAGRTEYPLSSPPAAQLPSKGRRDATSKYSGELLLAADLLVFFSALGARILISISSPQRRWTSEIGARASWSDSPERKVPLFCLDSLFTVGAPGDGRDEPG